MYSTEKRQRELLQQTFGKGNYKRKWNHGGRSLYVKEENNTYILYAYDYESFIKDLEEQ